MIIQTLSKSKLANILLNILSGTNRKVILGNCKSGILDNLSDKTLATAIIKGLTVSEVVGTEEQGDKIKQRDTLLKAISSVLVDYIESNIKSAVKEDDKIVVAKLKPINQDGTINIEIKSIKQQVKKEEIVK